LDGTNSPPSYLIAKLSLVFVALLKTTWLASWDDPVPLLIELYNRSEDSRALVLQIFRYIIEDYCLTKDEPMPRKRLLTQMLSVACHSEETLRVIYPDGVEWLETLPGWTKWGVPGQVGLLGLVASTVHERTTEILAGNTPDRKVIREILAAIKLLQVCIPWAAPRFDYSVQMMLTLDLWSKSIYSDCCIRRCLSITMTCGRWYWIPCMS